MQTGVKFAEEVMSPKRGPLSVNLHAIFSRFCRSFPANGRRMYLASEVLLSPILVRPVREQLEHDRVIRLLQAKYKRKFEVAINPGNEQNAPVGNGTVPVVSRPGAAVRRSAAASCSAWSRSRPPSR